LGAKLQYKKFDFALNTAKIFKEFDQKRSLIYYSVQGGETLST